MEDKQAQDINQSPEVFREIGKSLLNSTDPTQRSAGVSNPFLLSPEYYMISLGLL